MMTASDAIVARVIRELRNVRTGLSGEACNALATELEVALELQRTDDDVIRGTKAAL